jgi:hypothetical protein
MIQWSERFTFLILSGSIGIQTSVAFPSVLDPYHGANPVNPTGITPTTVEPERFAKRIGVAVEPTLPEGVADDNGLELLLTFFCAKDSPQGGLHSDQVEKVLSR